jgi:membrane fusion protein (multidrug efflux system)
MVSFMTHLGRSALASLMFLGFVVTDASSQVQAPQDAQRTMSPPSSLPAAQTPPRSSTEIRGQLVPRRYTTIAAEISARVKIIGAAEGMPFKEGQPLVGFDCALQEAQLTRAKVNLDVSRRQLAVQARLAELNATGRQEVDQAEGEVAKHQAEVSQIEVVLTKCVVMAPFPGRVAEQRVREQQFVQAGQPLLEIIDDSVLEVEFIMPSRWLASVRQGMAVRIAVDETGKTYPGSVLRLGARVDPVSQSIKAVAAINGRPAELVAGMSGRLVIPGQ